MQKRKKKADLPDSKAGVHRNVRARARMVQEMVAEHYEPGRQDRCKSWVYRHVVSKRLPMSERTFWRYLQMDLEQPPKSPTGGLEERQLKLFD